MLRFFKNNGLLTHIVLPFISYVDVAPMLLKGGKPVLPYSLQVSQSLILPMLNTVNDLDAEVLLPTPGEVTAELCTLSTYFLSMPTMPDMEGVTCGPCILLGASQAGYHSQ